MSKLLPSYHQVLFKFVAVFIFLPTLLIFVFIFNNLFDQNLKQAQTSVDEHAMSLVSEIRAEVSSLEIQFLKLLNNKAIAEVPVNILFSQNALVSLQDFVNDNPLVKGVFVQDDSGFIIEAWPVSMLGFKSENMNIYTLEAMEGNYQENNIRLLWFSPNQYEIISTRQEEDTPPNSHQLIMSAAIYGETDSIIHPYRATGSLNVILELDELMVHRDSEDNLRHHNIYLSAGKQILATDREHEIKKPLSSTQATRVLLEQYATRTMLNITVEYDEVSWTGAFWRQTTLQVLPLLLLLPFMLWGMFRFTKTLKKPISDMVEMCRSFASGNYNIAETKEEEKQVKYREFDLLFRRMNNMASTIGKQIENLELEKTKAEKSEKIKSQFLANMSHEIRTPMNGVLGMLQLLEAEELKQEQSARVKIAKTSAQNLLNIINDILDISKIEANKLEIETVPCDVATLIQAQIEALQHTAQKRGNVIKGLIKPPFHNFWLTDPTRLTQVVNNLASNAIKFTKDGKIMVILAQPSANQFQITVKDTGIGIPENKLASLFEPFQQADSSTTREYGGTGLGLSITKNLCELMGGSLTVTSEVGKGSAFVATIEANSVENLDESEHCTAQEDDEYIDSKDKVAVVAEDNIINQEVLKAMLADYSLALHFAENGRDAVTLTEHFEPDIILMDVHMPILDGVSATRRIRELGITTPILMQTANVMNEDVAHYREAGANDVVAKPIVKQELHNALKKWLK